MTGQAVFGCFPGCLLHQVFVLIAVYQLHYHEYGIVLFTWFLPDLSLFSIHRLLWNGIHVAPEEHLGSLCERRRWKILKQEFCHCFPICLTRNPSLTPCLEIFPCHVNWEMIHEQWWRIPNNKDNIYMVKQGRLLRVHEYTFVSPWFLQAYICIEK